MTRAKKPRAQKNEKSKKPKVAKKRDDPLDPMLLEDASDTELVALARKAGFHNASRRQSRAELTAMALGRGSRTPDILRSVRDRVFAFLTANKRSIDTARMTCSLHCPTCPHNLVVECHVDNHGVVDAYLDGEPND